MVSGHRCVCRARGRVTIWKGQGVSGRGYGCMGRAAYMYPGECGERERETERQRERERDRDRDTETER